MSGGGGSMYDNIMQQQQQGGGIPNAQYQGQQQQPQQYGQYGGGQQQGGGMGGMPQQGMPMQGQYGGQGMPMQQQGQPMRQMMPMQMMPQAPAQPAGGGGTMTTIGGGGGEGDYYRGFYEGIIRNGGPNFGSAMSWVAPIAINLVLFLGPLWYIRRKYAAQMAMATGEAGKKGTKDSPMGGLMDMMNPMKAKNYRVEVKNLKFKDVIGIPEAKEELKQYVDFLSEPKKFTRLGARLPKGCLLTGKPGTGKTLLAKAIAGEAKTPFFSCSGADFIEIFGGSGPKRVRELFNEAKQNAPCVVFIDEIDAIGSRGGGRSMGGGSSEENRTINQLLAELDGMSSSQAIVVVAATNYPDAVDKALLREGRFDRKVNIPMPDAEARNELFNFYLKKVITGDAECKAKLCKIKTHEQKEAEAEKVKKMSTAEAEAAKAKPEEDEYLETIVVDGVSNKEYAKILSDRTPGVSPAQIATIVNEAALTSAAEDEKVVNIKYLQDAIDDVLIGKKHRQRMSNNSLKRTAYHECGHAIMGWLSPLQKDVIKISVIPRGRAGGYTQQTQDEALDPQTDSFLFSQLCMLLGGRAAERLIMGDISTGAVDDLQRATKIAIGKLLHYGMSKEVGQIAFKPSEKQDGRAWMNYSENLHAKVEKEAREMVDKAYAHTIKTLTENKDNLHTLALLLLEKKELMKDDIVPILGPKAIKAVAESKLLAAKQ